MLRDRHILVVSPYDWNIELLSSHLEELKRGIGYDGEQVKIRDYRVVRHFPDAIASVDKLYPENSLVVAYSEIFAGESEIVERCTSPIIEKTRERRIPTVIHTTHAEGCLPDRLKHFLDDVK